MAAIIYYVWKPQRCDVWDLLMPPSLGMNNQHVWYSGAVSGGETENKQAYNNMKESMIKKTMLCLGNTADFGWILVRAPVLPWRFLRAL